jgi:hypothetical protein
MRDPGNGCIQIQGKARLISIMVVLQQPASSRANGPTIGGPFCNCVQDPALEC